MQRGKILAELQHALTTSKKVRLQFIEGKTERGYATLNRLAEPGNTIQFQDWSHLKMTAILVDGDSDPVMRQMAMTLKLKFDKVVFIREMIDFLETIEVVQ